MAEGWTDETMHRFEDALAHLGAGNGKALKFSRLLAQTSALEDKQLTVAVWRSLTSKIVRDGDVAAAPQDLPNWFGLAAFFEEWTQREGVPVGQVSEPQGE